VTTTAELYDCHRAHDCEHDELSQERVNVHCAGSEWLRRMAACLAFTRSGTLESRMSRYPSGVDLREKVGRAPRNGPGDFVNTRLYSWNIIIFPGVIFAPVVVSII